MEKLIEKLGFIFIMLLYLTFLMAEGLVYESRPLTVIPLILIGLLFIKTINIIRAYH